MGGDGPPVWLPLDAKYRVERDAVGRSFESVHIYRDSLRDIGRGGACAHAALLAPAITAESAPWFAQEFFDEFLCGVFEVVPGGTGMGRSVQWLARVLRLA